MVRFWGNIFGWTSNLVMIIVIMKGGSNQANLLFYFIEICNLVSQKEVVSLKIYILLQYYCNILGLYAFQ